MCEQGRPAGQVRPRLGQAGVDTTQPPRALRAPEEEKPREGLGGR